MADGNSVVLRNNDGDDLTVNVNDVFTFATPLPDGSDYNVSVLSQPTDPNQTCEVENGFGTISGANVNNVLVDCTTNTYTVGGTVTGLADGNEVVLQNNGDDDLIVSNNDVFTFATALPDSSAYLVEVLTQPTDPNQTCVVANADGTVSGADVDEIDVTCTTDTYVVTTNVTNGNITSDIDPEIEHGQTTIVTGAANPNYYFSSVSGCGGTPQSNTDQSVENFSYETGPITEACTVEAVFAIRTYDVTAINIGNGSITPPSQTIDHGDSASFTVAPDPNHHLVSVTGDNCAPTDQGGGIWIAPNITQTCAVTATFAINTYTVTTTAINGMITSPENPIIGHGASTTVTGEADANHYFASVSGCGGMLQSNTDQSVEDFSYETGPITEACTVEAVFAIRTYTVTTSATNGSITSPENPVVDHGASTTVTGEADPNHYFASVSGCGGTPQSNTDQSVEDFSYDSGPITEACTVEAVFAIKTYNISTTVQGAGTVDVLTPVVEHGANAEFELVPAAGWSLRSFEGDSCTPVDNGNGSWTAQNITEDCAVQAVFVEDTMTQLSLSRHPALVGEPVTYTISVTGSASAPADGEVELSSDSDGVICSIASPDATNGNTATFICQYSWTETGSHELTASFSGSETHADSSVQITQDIVADEFIFQDRFEPEP